jgi:H+-transporting ATPase
VFKTFITTTSQLILLLFLTDFITISLATDNVAPSSRPERWEVGRMTKVALAVSVVVLLEMTIELYLAVTLFHFNINTSSDQLDTFVFYVLMVTGIMDVFIVRERRSFWNSMPGKPLMAALLADLAFVTVLSIVGVSGLLSPIPLFAVFVVLAVAVLMLFPKDYVKKSALKHESSRETKQAYTSRFNRQEELMTIA